MNQALDDLEAVLLERAAHGVEKPVFYGGKPCGKVRQYSDTLAMFILRAKRPNTYGRAATGDPQSPVEEDAGNAREKVQRSEEHTSELQSLMRISYAVFCLKKKKKKHQDKDQIINEK